MTGFPVHRLSASGGEIYCHLFENPRTGLPRNIYWSFTLDFDPIEYEGAEWETSMTAEWLTLPLRDWRDLAGRAFTLSYGDGDAEASFYAREHHIAKTARLEIGMRNGRTFELAMEMIVDFQGLTGADHNPNMTVQGRAVVPYAGAIVVPDNLVPTLNTPAEVARAVSRYLDTPLLAPPERRGHAFRMEPLAGI
jgi:hypothetical protein